LLLDWLRPTSWYILKSFHIAPILWCDILEFDQVLETLEYQTWVFPYEWVLKLVKIVKSAQNLVKNSKNADFEI
jgi:hypothetical protein